MQTLETKETHKIWMRSKLNLVDPEDNKNEGIWLDRGADQAAKVYDEFTYKIERENRFLQMLHLGVQEIRDIELKAEGKPVFWKEKASMDHRTNLVGYMLTQMTLHSDNLLEQMLQKMLENLHNDEDSDSDSDCETSSKMLVFKDMKGQVWQICKADESYFAPVDAHNFDQLLDDAAPDLNHFTPEQR